MFSVVISQLDVSDEVEIVERKGIGHPDTICDALAKRFHEIYVRNIDGGLVKFSTTTSTRRCCVAAARPQCLAAALSSRQSTFISPDER